MQYTIPEGVSFAHILIEGQGLKISHSIQDPEQFLTIAKPHRSGTYFVSCAIEWPTGFGQFLPMQQIEVEDVDRGIYSLPYEH